MISPSLRKKVTRHIFLDSINQNPIFSQDQEVFDFLINDVHIILFMPEDQIITQGQKEAEYMFFIAKGNCTVWVKDHMKQNIKVNSLSQGDMFGEIALLTNSGRTATVKSQNYCTMASLSKKVFFDLC